MLQKAGSMRITVALALVVLLAGCTGVGFLDDDTPVELDEEPTTEVPDTDPDDASDDDADEAEQDDTTEDEETEPAFDGPDPYVNTMESLDGSTADDFDAAFRDDDGEFVAEASEFFDLLEATEEIDPDARDAVAERVAEEGTIEDDTMEQLERTLSSTETVQMLVFENDFEKQTDDGFLDGEALAFGLSPNGEHPEVAEVAEPLGSDGYDELEREYLARVGDLASDQNNQYKGWSQAEELGLLSETTADGEIDEDDLWAIEDDAGNELINEMEEEFGTDPQQADTSGDGFDDNLKWGPLRDLGLEVNPDEVDVYIEMDIASAAEEPSYRQLQAIRSAMNTESGDDIPRVNLHFERCDTNIQSPTNPDQMDERMHEHHQAHGYGFHYYLMSNSDLTWDQRVVDGMSRSSRGGTPSWIVANLDSDDSANEQNYLIAHELGHAFGLYSHDFDGIDSVEYSATEYNSVMNYNDPGVVTFSTGSPFNDYEEMYNNQFGQVYQSQDDLEAAWENGGIPEDQEPCGGF